MDVFNLINQALSFANVRGKGSGTASDGFIPHQISLSGETEIALGNIDGATEWNALGERENMGIVTNGEDIWRGNELSPPPTSTTSIPIPATAGDRKGKVPNTPCGGTRDAFIS